MMITFEMISIYDFMAIDRVVYDYLTDDVRLLLGRNVDSTAADDNGAGKSSFAEALRWCLYGETTRQVIDKTLTVEHVMREGAKRVSVEVVFNDGRTTYQVNRTRTATTQMIRVITSPMNTPKGMQVPATSVKGKDAQALINEALGINAIQFSNLVYLDGSYPMLFAPSSDRNRKDILADLVDVAAVEEAREVIGRKLAPIRQEISALEVQRERENAKIELIFANKEKIRQQAKDVKATGIRFKEHLETSKLQVKEAKENLAEAEVAWSLAEAADTKAEDDAVLAYEASEALYGTARAENEVALTTYLAREIDDAKTVLHSLEQDYALLTNQISKIEKLRAAGMCPTCSQETDTAMEGDLADYQERLKDVADALPGNRQTCEELESKRRENINTTSRAAKERSNERDAAYAALNALRKAQSNQVLVDAKTEAQRELDKAERVVEANRGRITHARERIVELKVEYKDCDDQIERLDWKSGPECLRADELAKQHDNLMFWRDGFGPKGVPSLFIETVLPKISARIQTYANILTGGDLTVQLKAYKETKSNTIQESIQISAVNSKGASVYGSNSAGERNRINLAVTLGLIEYFRDMNVFESNLLICDEIFDGLDATGVQQALYALAEANMTHVIVVSHHEQLKPLFPNVMYMTKENGSSTLEV